MMNTNRIFRLIVLAQLAVSALYFCAGHVADQAMDKSGIGDYESFRFWSNWAGAAFWIFIGLWGLSIATFMVSELYSTQKTRFWGSGLPAVSTCGLPLMFAAFYVGFLILC